MEFNSDDSNIRIVHKYIRSASMNEIRELTDLIRTRKETLGRQKMQELKVGDKVTFDNKGKIISGTIRKKNIKRVVVDTEMGGWNVPVNVLEPV
tara:strand:- start:2313 stop:2594 length:282 start_codon:yes stop_codon:yes gene_type:complete